MGTTILTCNYCTYTRTVRHDEGERVRARLCPRLAENGERCPGVLTPPPQTSCREYIGSDIGPRGHGW